MFATMQDELMPGRPARAQPSQSRVIAERPRIEDQATPSDTYPALGEPLAIELANTLFTDRGPPLDALTTPAALARWLETNAERIDQPLPRRLGVGDLERARELRAMIRALLATAIDVRPPTAATVRRLNDLAAVAPFTPRLHWRAGEPPKARHSSSGAGRLDTLLALLAQSAIDVLGGSGAGRLRRCQAPGCISYYLKDHPRRAWCSPRCGNRVRVARHYQLRRRAGK